MSKNIDERVVQMQFDNAQFLDGVKGTLSGLSSLQNGLSNLGNTTAFDDISVAANNTDFSGFYSGLESVQRQFSALEVMAFSVINNITNRITNMGMSLAKSVSVDQIGAGWGKYTQKTASVQTLVNATGKSLNEINGYLNKLMWYSDETSYGFTDMTAALATMTSSGGDIDKLIPMIEGVANATAYAGKGAAEFSRIMQFSINQAYSSGAMQVQDWKTIESATVNSKQLMQALIDAGVELKKIKKGEITLSNFRSSLKDKWLDKSVMEKGFGQFAKVTEEIYKGVQNGTFENYADGLAKIGNTYGEVASRAAASSQEAKTFTEAIDATKDAVSSGWMQTFELIFGNYEEAKKLWTDLANAMWEVFASGGEERNEELQTWKDIGGREIALKGIYKILSNIDKIITAVKEGFASIFPNTLANTMLKISFGLEAIGDATEPSLNQLSRLKRVVEGVASVLSFFKKLTVSTFKGFAKGIQPILTSLSGLGDSLLYLFNRIGIKLTDLNKQFTHDKGFTNWKNTVVNTLTPVATFIAKIIDKISEGVMYIYNHMDSLQPIFDAVRNTVESFFGTFNNFKNLATNNIFTTIIDGIANSVSKAKEVLGRIIDELKQMFTNLVNSMYNPFKTNDFSDVKSILVPGGILAGLIFGVKKMLSSFTIKGSFIDTIKNVINTLSDSLDKLTNTAKPDILINIAKSIGILAVSLLLMASIDQDKLGPAMVAMSAMLAELYLFLDKINGKFNAKSIGIINAVGIGMIQMAAAILIMSLAIRAMGSLDEGKMAGGVLAIGALLFMLQKVAKSMSNKKAEKLTKGLGGLIAFAIAIRVLASAVEKLGSLDVETLGNGLLGVVALIGALLAFTKFGNIDKVGFGTGMGLLLLSSGVVVLAAATKMIAQLSWEEIAKGLVGVGAILVSLGLFTKLLDNKKLVSSGLGLTILSAGVAILAHVVKTLGALDAANIVNGLGALGIILAEVAVALWALPKDVASKGAGLILVAAAVNVLAVAVHSLAKLKADDLTKGLIGLGVSLASVVIALRLMKGTKGAAASLIVTSVAINILALAVKSLGEMPIDKLIIGVGALAGVFALLGLAGTVLAPLSPILLTLAGAFALIGVGALAFGLGLTSISVGLFALAAAISGTVGGILAGLGLLLKGLVKLVIDILAEIANALLTSVPGLVAGITVVGMAILQAIALLVPQVIETAITVFTAFLKGIADNIYQVTSLALQIIVEFVNALTVYMPILVQAGVELIIAFINGIANAIANNAGPLWDAIGNLFSSLLIFILEGLQEIVQGIEVFGLGDKMSSGIQSVIDSLKTNMTENPELKSAGMLAGTSTASGVEASGEQMSTSTANLMSHFSGKIQELYPQDKLAGQGAADKVIDGIDSKQSAANQAGIDLSQYGINGVDSMLDSFVTAGSNSGQGLVSGAASQWQSMYDTGVSLADALHLGYTTADNQHSPSKEMAKYGKFSVLGLVNSINGNIGLVQSAGSSMAGSLHETIQEAVSKIADTSISTDINPVITPVLDLSNVESGARQLSGMLPDSAAYQASASFNLNAQNDDVARLVAIGNKLLQSVQNGSDLYLDENILVGRINRRLGQL